MKSFSAREEPEEPSQLLILEAAAVLEVTLGVEAMKATAVAARQVKISTWPTLWGWVGMMWFTNHDLHPPQLAGTRMATRGWAGTMRFKYRDLHPLRSALEAATTLETTLGVEARKARSTPPLMR